MAKADTILIDRDSMDEAIYALRLAADREAISPLDPSNWDWDAYPIVLRPDGSVLDGNHRIVGVGKKHLQAYLNEFAFRFNRRFWPHNAFRSLLGIGANGESPTYEGLYSGEWKHPTVSQLTN